MGDFCARLMAYMERMKASNTSTEMAVVYANVTGLGPTDTYRRIRATFGAYLGGVRVTAGALQVRTVQLAVLPPPPLEAPIMGTIEMQAVADANVLTRNLAAVAAASAALPYAFRALACLAGDVNCQRSLDQMVRDVAAALPPLNLLRGAGDAPARTRWGDSLIAGGPDATEDEFLGAIREVLMVCAVGGFGRISSWMSELADARAVASAFEASHDKRMKDANEDKTKWTDEDVVALQVKFQADKEYGGWKVPLHFLLRKKDCAVLFLSVRLGRLPVGLEKMPWRTRPFSILGSGTVLYKEIWRQTPNSGGEATHELVDEDEPASGAPSAMTTYVGMRNWLYTVMALGRGVSVPGAEAGGSPQLWCTPLPVLAYLEMLLTVSAVASVSAAAFGEYCALSLDKVIHDVNGVGGSQISLSSALDREVMAMEDSIRALCQQKALLGVASLSAPILPLTCSGCVSKDAKILSLTASVTSLTNLNDNKAALLARYSSAHGALPTPAGAKSSTAQGAAGGGSGTSVTFGGKVISKRSNARAGKGKKKK